MADDPFVMAAREALDDALGDVRASIEGAPAAALNWRPAGDDTNSIAVLGVHAMSSTRSWLAVAMGAPLPPRDRDSEFRATQEDAGALLSFVDAMRADCIALLELPAPDDWGIARKTHARPAPDAPDHVAAAWALLHALEHLREHAGQLMLTRQLWDARA